MIWLIVVTTVQFFFIFLGLANKQTTENFFSAFPLQTEALTQKHIQYSTTRPTCSMLSLKSSNLVPLIPIEQDFSNGSMQLPPNPFVVVRG